MPRRVAVAVYPGCIFFEIALAIEALSPAFRVEFYSPDGQPHEASNGARIAVDGSLADLEVAEVAAVLVPGGDPQTILVPRDLASAALRAQAARGALLAGICAGGLVLAAAGLLRGRRGTHNYTPEFATAEQVATTQPYWAGMTYVRADVVQDGAVITAQPWAYRKFAARVARELGVLGSREANDLETYVQRKSVA